MDEFVFFGEFRMKEYARKAEQLNRQAWMIAEASEAERWLAASCSVKRPDRNQPRYPSAAGSRAAGSSPDCSATAKVHSS